MSFIESAMIAWLASASPARLSHKKRLWDKTNKIQKNKIEDQLKWIINLPSTRHFIGESFETSLRLVLYGLVHLGYDEAVFDVPL